ncbi:hypothetical protein ES288_D10G199900v1 [Gossypium darwinii]|uniref:Tubby C-terminal domain-containing protein n=2 Tax=Gossypium TaxID=3633 RepID=A0A7J8VQ98_9ROSI|nr:hypothetical protein [Gossypium klotzschianum]TYG50736.1 hypothetical protein ES288_D10G199900v1 [Gossypium darwinii]
MAIKCIARLRSRRVVQDQLQTPNEVEAEGGCCWANLPQELLWEVLLMIEETESIWPQRKNVVACAGVCRSWRFIIQQIVKLPQLSGKLTFPISVKQPGPKDSLLQCFIKRNRSTQTYYLYLGLTNSALSDGGKFLLAARKCRRPTCTDYIISLQAEDFSKGTNTYAGRLRSNFLGTKFTVFDGQSPQAGAKMGKSRSSRLANLRQVSPSSNYPMAHISYELNLLGSRGPRRMQCNMNTIPATSIAPGGLDPTTQAELNPYQSTPTSFLSKSASMENSVSDQKNGGLVLINKAPRWHEQLQCWCLNFHGRVTIASVKNFQLVASPENEPAGPEHEKIILQFGKVGKDLFTMDYRYPISAFQAFAICLSSFETRIACE